MASVHRFSAGSLQDWTPQERGEIVAAHIQLTDLYGALEIDHGLTDQGQPWAVLVNAATQDVVAHFAKLPGGMIADLPEASELVEAPTLREAISRVMARCGLPYALQAERERTADIISLFGQTGRSLAALAIISWSLVTAANRNKARADEPGDGANDEAVLALARRKSKDQLAQSEGGPGHSAGFFAFRPAPVDMRPGEIAASLLAFLTVTQVLSADEAAAAHHELVLAGLDGLETDQPEDAGGQKPGHDPRGALRDAGPETGMAGPGVADAMAAIDAGGAAVAGAVRMPATALLPVAATDFDPAALLMAWGLTADDVAQIEAMVGDLAAWLRGDAVRDSLSPPSRAEATGTVERAPMERASDLPNAVRQTANKPADDVSALTVLFVQSLRGDAATPARLNDLDVNQLSLPDLLKSLADRDALDGFNGRAFYNAVREQTNIDETLALRFVGAVNRAREEAEDTGGSQDAAPLRSALMNAQETGGAPARETTQDGAALSPSWTQWSQTREADATSVAAPETTPSVSQPVTADNAPSALEPERIETAPAPSDPTPSDPAPVDTAPMDTAPQTDRPLFDANAALDGLSDTPVIDRLTEAAADRDINVDIQPLQDRAVTWEAVDPKPATPPQTAPLAAAAVAAVGAPRPADIDADKPFAFAPKPGPEPTDSFSGMKDYFLEREISPDPIEGLGALPEFIGYLTDRDAGITDSAPEPIGRLMDDPDSLPYADQFFIA